MIKIYSMEQNQYKTLLKDLTSANEATVLDAIEQLRDSGQPGSLKPLANLWVSSPNKTITTAIYDLFCDLKQQEIVAEMVEIVFNPLYADIQTSLLSACWLSRIEFPDYLEKFIDLIYTRQFSVAFEAFTVIENMESKISAQRKTELINYIEAYNQKESSLNQALTDSLLGIVEQYETH